MLTSVYYYSLYKPYLVGTREVDSFSPRRPKITDKKTANEFNGQIFVLNKSMKDEIVRHAQNVSFGVTGLRSSTRQTAQDMEDFNKTAHEEGFEEAVGELTADISRFADNYNKTADYLQKQEHSTGLRSFSYEVEDNVRYNKNRLELLGITLGDGGKMNFDKTRIEKMSHEEINISIGETIKIFSDLQGYADQLLTEPLVEHMSFKGLGYHYNYKMGLMQADGFNLIEAGLIIDKAV